MVGDMAMIFLGDAFVAAAAFDRVFFVGGRCLRQHVSFVEPTDVDVHRRDWQFALSRKRAVEAQVELATVAVEEESCVIDWCELAAVTARGTVARWIVHVLTEGAVTG